LTTFHLVYIFVFKAQKVEGSKSEVLHSEIKLKKEWNNGRNRIKLTE